MGLCLPGAGVEGVPQPVGDEVRAEHEDRDGEARDEKHFWMEHVRCAAVLGHRSPRGIRRVDPEAVNQLAIVSAMVSERKFCSPMIASVMIAKGRYGSP